MAKIQGLLFMVEKVNKSKLTTAKLEIDERKYSLVVFHNNGDRFRSEMISMSIEKSYPDDVIEMFLDNCIDLLTKVLGKE